ncbi:flagellar basal body-associated FliL family protein [Mariprofundus sp. KV]|uniref:flagellar basal body-associated FliL family protein n=1 Tax=Mariprofundus sp. KV TaxID=2608715 RepID=UPI0015A49F46|nr:flagellar basal body-associated FliL family protein [Mariprofundus sp. KV]NWF35495.1 flagellar basal body-associated FliL family protein [Mariprofundus sp. KV]
MNKLLPIISTFLLLITLSAEGFVAWKLHEKSAPVEQTADEVAVAEEEETVEVEPVFMDLGETTVNLHGSDSDNNFLRIKITVLLNGADSQERITRNITQVTDLILNLLSAQTFADIRTQEGKESLKRDLIERINRLVGQDPIRDIFFVDFVSQ